MRREVERRKQEGEDPLRSEDIQRQIQALSGRDLQLWSISILVIMVLSSGFLAMIYPNMAWHPGILQVEEKYLPQFFFGLIALIGLFNIYIVAQKRTINATRRDLIRELVFNEKLESVSMVDPLTQLLNRNSLDMIVSHEVARANRLGTNLTFMVVNLDSLKSVREKHGAEAEDRFLLEVAKLLRATLRGTDRVLRYGNEEFLAVLPETSEQEAEQAIRRLLTAVDHWNLTTRTGWEVSLTYGLAQYVQGTELREAVRAAMRKMLLHKQKLVPVFMEVTSPKPGSPAHIVV